MIGAGHRSEKERVAIFSACRLGQLHGFGNLIDCLQLAWARELVQKHDMPIETALRGAWITDEEKIGRIGKLSKAEFLQAVADHLGERQ